MSMNKRKKKVCIRDEHDDVEGTGRAIANK